MSVVQSPLFEPVLWHDGGFKILDDGRKVRVAKRSGEMIDG